MHIGLIAGGGDLPKHIMRAAREGGHEVSVVILDGIANPANFPNGLTAGLAKFGKMVKFFKKSGCTHICMAGNVRRPDVASLKPDLKAMRYMPGLIKAAGRGDDALLRGIIDMFENEGFAIISQQDISASLLLPEGILGDVKLTEAHRPDAQRACEMAVKIGELDIGQGAVVCQGVVLAVEAQEGTDAMLRRVAKLPDAIKGSQSARKGVLAKMLKPTQDSRVDLPTIGPETVDLAALAGLAGIVAEGGRAFVIDRETVIEKANEAGLFIAGLPPSQQ